MSVLHPSRRAVLLLPLWLATCGEERTDFPPLHYNYLPPIRLAVSDIEVQTRFVPSGVPPDVTTLDPVRPSDALRAMAEERLQAFGGPARAVFAINNASLVKRDDQIDGALAVQLSIYGANGARVGFADANVARQHTGRIDDLRSTLYDMTRQMMDAMNVELEFQINQHMRGWLVTGGSVPNPVQQQQLDMPPPEPPPSEPPPPPPPSAR